MTDAIIRFIVGGFCIGSQELGKGREMSKGGPDNEINEWRKGCLKNEK